MPSTAASDAAAAGSGAPAAAAAAQATDAADETAALAAGMSRLAPPGCARSHTDFGIVHHFGRDAQAPVTVPLP